MRKIKKNTIGIIKSQKYRIYGIFNLKTKALLRVELDLEIIELEYDFGDYDKKHCQIISFDVILI